MPLRVELKPFERIIIGETVIINSGTRTSFLIDGEAPILREKDTVTAETANVKAVCSYRMPRPAMLVPTTRYTIRRFSIAALLFLRSSQRYSAAGPDSAERNQARRLGVAAPIRISTDTQINVVVNSVRLSVAGTHIR